MTQPARRPLTLILVALSLVVIPFLTWYFTWFGRPLDDETLGRYLRDQSKPRHIQHALVQLAHRIERKDPAARQWYPLVAALAADRRSEIRLTAAWLMGQDPSFEDFRGTLLDLLVDFDPIVRRNAALSLVRFRDERALPEIRSMLEPVLLRAPVGGMVSALAEEKSEVDRGGLVARVEPVGGPRSEVVSPVPGQPRRHVSNETPVAAGQILVSVFPDSQHVWEALRALYIMGTSQDISRVEAYASGGAGFDRRIQRQAEETLKQIRERQRQGLR